MSQLERQGNMQFVSHSQPSILVFQQSIFLNVNQQNSIFQMAFYLFSWSSYTFWFIFSEEEENM
jgi:hypothetical protein